MASQAALKEFLVEQGIITVLPSEPEYAPLNSYYQLSEPKTPLALVRPRSAAEVATVVKYATANDIKIVVRSGGGDLFGRSQVEGRLSIDMRLMNDVDANTARCTARIGGGCTVGHVAAELAQHKHITSFPPIPAVGYVGWATLGGYGPYAASFGLGVDQILGAKIVNWKGELMDAEEELLKGIRGGGGNFGIIVELIVKTYPLEKILGGLIMFESSNIASSLVDYTSAYNKLLNDGMPDALGIQGAAVNFDNGPQFAVVFVWSSSDLEKGRAYVDKIAALGKETMRAIKEITAREWMQMMSELVPYGVYGYVMSVSIRKITEEISRVIGDNLVKMPADKSTSFSWHELRGHSASPKDSSVFLAREPHYVLELLGTVQDHSNVQASEAWMNAFRADLLQCEDLLETSYISLTRPSHATLQTLYGPNLDFLKRLKVKYDPKGIFDLAVPRLSELV